MHNTLFVLLFCCRISVLVLLTTSNVWSYIFEGGRFVASHLDLFILLLLIQPFLETQSTIDFLEDDCAISELVHDQLVPVI